MQTSHLNPRRNQGTIALACVTLIFFIVIMGITYMIVVQACNRLPRPGCQPCGTNALMDVSMRLPEASLPQAYRVVLQRKLGTNDWDDLAAVNWNGSTTTFGVTTNWSTMGLFRVKAIPTQ